jgi:SAM-dependent methyltransferase
MTRDFSSVTELPGSRATAEQMTMIQTRYATAAALGAGKRVLEVACGPGRGLGLLARKAVKVVGGDYTFDLVRQAKAHYGARLPVLQFDAQAMPFVNGSFDLVVFFEAIYYLPDAERAIAEARRILSPGGVLLICSANREWEGFSASPFSTRYFAASELCDLMTRHGFHTELNAAFAAAPAGASSGAVATIRKVAVKLHLIPRTLAGRERLKRLFYGPLQPLAAELTDGGVRPAPLVPIKSGEPVPHFKVLYATGRVPV